MCLLEGSLSLPLLLTIWTTLYRLPERCQQLSTVATLKPLCQVIRWLLSSSRQVHRHRDQQRQAHRPHRPLRLPPPQRPKLPPAPAFHRNMGNVVVKAGRVQQPVPVRIPAITRIPTIPSAYKNAPRCLVPGIFYILGQPLGDVNF